MKTRALLIVLLVLMGITISGCGYLDEIKSSYEEDFDFEEFDDFDFEEFEEEFEDFEEFEDEDFVDDSDILVEDDLVSLEPNGELEKVDEIVEEDIEVVDDVVEDVVIVEDIVVDDTEPVDVKPTQQGPTKTFTEGDLVKLQLSATDPDGDELVYTFTAPLDNNGQWQTKEGDEGQYPVTVTVSDGKTTVSQQVMIIVDSANKAPVITGLSDVKVSEGETVSLTPTANDPDGDDVTVTYSGWMTKSTRETNFDSAGEHEVVVSATDGKKTTTQTVSITVDNVNRAPLLKSVSDVTVLEGELVSLSPSFADPDGDDLTVSYSDKIGANGEWQTSIGEDGEYVVTVTVSDGELTDSVDTKIIVQSLNKAPVLELVADITVDEGETVSLSPAYNDPEEDDVTVTYSGWMSSPSYTTTFSDAGIHTVTITLSDGDKTTSQDVKVTVVDVNRAPVLVIN